MVRLFPRYASCCVLIFHTEVAGSVACQVCAVKPTVLQLPHHVPLAADSSSVHVNVSCRAVLCSWWHVLRVRHMAALWLAGRFKIRVGRPAGPHKLVHSYMQVHPPFDLRR